MSDARTFAIVGAGLAGAKAAEALRADGVDEHIVLLGAEAHRPYERPPLSKGYLQGSAARETVYVHPPEWYAEHQVDLRLSTAATGIERRAHELVTTDGNRLRYDKLLLATGATPRRLPVPGSDLAGVLYLRSLDDSDRLKAAFRPGARVVIIGGGWIGLETAAAARMAGAEVAVLEQAELPLLHVLGHRVAMDRAIPTVVSAHSEQNGSMNISATSWLRIGLSSTMMLRAYVLGSRAPSAKYSTGTERTKCSGAMSGRSVGAKPQPSPGHPHHRPEMTDLSREWRCPRNLPPWRCSTKHSQTEEPPVAADTQETNRLRLDQRKLDNSGKA